jgi:hypothetical protein
MEAEMVDSVAVAVAEQADTLAMAVTVKHRGVFH